MYILSNSFRTSNTRIEHNINPSYEPLVSISDNDHSEFVDVDVFFFLYLSIVQNQSPFSDDNYVTPVHKLTQSELREELQPFRNHNDDDDDTGDLEFRTQQPSKHSNCCSCFIS